ncbi:Gfo/Idh/MocA family protein [Litoribacterium kuwaitense]|uniref:Gfo/Idh/MocA family protein n=1 Tax=Litoribacterium kuwaitense TaxID=1398745 RepID=UPI0028AADDD2|nr:Gfo/Idh/MocA family oxidoreductase [Litoribacterium kuwaitense]
MRQISAILLGAGNRGNAYSEYALKYPYEFNIVAIADPDEKRRRDFADKYDIPQEQAFSSWEQILAQPQLAEVAIITTQDTLHYAPTIRALERGYHVLVEKPMSPRLDECIQMVEAAQRYRKQLSICHVLRYTPFWTAVKQVVDSGEIGDIVSIQLNENVGNLHMAHSYVRGNWRNSETSSPMILAKSSHDLDIISWLIGKPCRRVSSFGSLMHFSEENAPIGATPYCLDGCPAQANCSYYAPRYYANKSDTFLKKITSDTSRAGVLEALKTGPYGKCVYQTDNNVVDHQVVNFEFQGGATATFSMCGFTHDTSRSVQIMGTKGEIRGYMKDHSFTVYDFLTNRKKNIQMERPTSGHAGGDEGIMRSFLQEIRSFHGGQGLTSA